MYQIKCVIGCLLMMLLLAPAMPAWSQANDSTNARTTRELLDISWGMRVKLVWARTAADYRGNMQDNMGPGHVLVVFDTDEKRERVLQATSGSYDHPFITRDGTRVIWNDRANAESWICNWDGTGKARLLKGNTTTIGANISGSYRDSATQKEYVYAGVADGNQGTWGCVVQQNIFTYPLTGLALDTAQKKVLWNGALGGGGLCCMSYFTGSADGKYAVGEMSGGTNCLGLLDLASQKIVETRSPKAGSLGCMPNSAPDNSRRWFHAMSGHSYIHMYKYGGADTSILVRPDSYFPNMGAWSPGGLEHMRWSSHVRFLVGGASMAFNGSSSDVSRYNYQFYLERFDSSFTKIEKIVQVSHAPLGFPSFNGDAWFGSASTNAHRGYSSSVIRNSIRPNQQSFAYDIQGRRISTSNDRLQKTVASKSKGVWIENGLIRVKAY
jgi:hypothetical protein